MRFALLTNHNGTSWGGSEELWAATALRLAARGHAVRVAVPEGYAAHPRVAKLRAVPSIDVAVLEPTLPGWRERIRRRLLPTAWHSIVPDPLHSWLARARAENAFVVVSLPGFRSNLRRLTEANLAASPYAFVVHGYHPSDWIADSELEMFRKFYAGAALQCFVTRDTEQFAQRALGTELPGARIVRNPFNVDYNHPPPFPSDAATELRIAMVAALDCGTKGQDLIFEVLAREKWRERPVKLSCHGDGPNRQLLTAWIERARLERVQLAGHTRDLGAVWARAHLGLMASRYEGLPIAMVEGMLAARPFVSTGVGGCPELVIEGRTGFLARHPSADELDAALERAWLARGELAALGANARHRVQSLIPADPAADFASLLETAAAPFCSA